MIVSKLLDDLLQYKLIFIASFKDLLHFFNAVYIGFKLSFYLNVKIVYKLSSQLP